MEGFYGPYSMINENMELILKEEKTATFYFQILLIMLMF